MDRPTSLRFSILASLLLASAPAALGAQDGAGSIRGVVSTAAGAPLFGASVRVGGTTLGAQTDAGGRFTVTRVPAGRHEVSVRAIGYRPETRAVDVTGGSAVELAVSLTADPLRIEAVVVTGTRSARVTKEATASAAVLDQQTLAQRSPNFTVADAVRSIPGIHAENGGGELASNVFVRGIPSPGQQRYLMMLENGLPVQSAINLSAEDVLIRQDLNVEQLEVVKGGTSTVFGVSRPGGILNYIDRTGGPTRVNTVQATTAQRGLYRVDLNSNGPLGERWRYSVGGFFRRDDGPLESRLPTEGGQLKANVTRLLGRGYVRAYVKYLNDRAQFFLPVPYAQGAETAAVGDLGTLNTAAANDVVVSGLNGGFFGGTFRSRMENGILVRGPVGTLELDTEFGGGWRVVSRARASDLAHEFNIFLPGSNTASADAFARPFLTNPAWRPVYSYANDPAAPFGAAGVLTQDARYRNRPFTEYANETQLQRRLRAAGAEHALTLGGFVSRTEQADQQFSPTTLIELASAPRLVDLEIRGGAAGTAGDTVVRRITSGGLTRLSSAYTNAEYATGIAALFAGDEVRVGDRWRIDLGARYERQRTTIDQEQTAPQTIGATEAGRNVAIGNGQFLDRTVRFDDWAATAGVNYAATRTSNVYVSGSRGFRIPDASFFTSLALDPEGNFRQPEISKSEQFLQAEAGYRLTTPAFGLSVAPFYVNIRNRLQSDLRILPGGTSAVVTDAVGETRTIGVEGTAVVAPPMLPGATLQAAVTLQDHEALDFRQVPTILLRNAAGAVRDSVTSNSGNKIRRQPNTMLDLSAGYDRNGFDGLANWNYIGARFADDANLQELEGFGVVTLSGGYTFNTGAGQRARAGLSVYNLLDSRGRTEGDPRLAGGIDPGSLAFLNFRPILPRRVLFNVRYDF